MNSTKSCTCNLRQLQNLSPSREMVASGSSKRSKRLHRVSAKSLYFENWRGVPTRRSLRSPQLLWAPSCLRSREPVVNCSPPWQNMPQEKLRMSCDLDNALLHSYFDGELSVIGAAEFQYHLARCSDCIDELAAMSSVRGSLKHARLYESAPASLRLKIRVGIHSRAPQTRPSPLLGWRGLAAAAAIVLVALILWRGGGALWHEGGRPTDTAAWTSGAHRRPAFARAHTTPTFTPSRNPTRSFGCTQRNSSH